MDKAIAGVCRTATERRFSKRNPLRQSAARAALSDGEDDIARMLAEERSDESDLASDLGTGGKRRASARP